MAVFALVTVPIASLHREPTRNCSLEDEVLYGMKVEILLEETKEWVRVRTHYRYEGLLEKTDLLFDPEKLAAWENAEKRVVLQPFADVLSMPKVQGANVISLVKGSLVRLLQPADENGWVTVGLADGRTGYMKEKFLGKYKKASFVPSEVISSEEEFRNAVCETALSYLGTQYRWGGKTALGIDCSGLCSIAYLLNGVIIYRDANMAQGFAMHETALQAIKKGDLIFFPGHVAMYLGDGKYVHSTGKNGSDGVVVNSLNPEDSDYREDLVKIIKAVGTVF